MKFLPAGGKNDLSLENVTKDMRSVEHSESRKFKL
jgi:hypothetical protein